MRWRDRQGDVWERGDDGLLHTRETAPFPRGHVEKKWGPLVPLDDEAAHAALFKEPETRVLSKTASLAEPAPVEEGDVLLVGGMPHAVTSVKAEPDGSWTVGLAPAPWEHSLPLHRTEAGWPRCATCDGGGCPDCTDPAG